MNQYQVVIFDFDGVLSRGKFYANLRKQHFLVWQFIQENVFDRTGTNKIVDLWLRGEVGWQQVNCFVSKQTGLHLKKLNGLFVESVKQMKVEKGPLKLALKLKNRGVKLALVTNHMDIFNEVIIRHLGLDEIFPVIVNSCDHGVFKSEQNGFLFDMAMKGLGENDYNKALLIDDSLKNCEVFSQKGGKYFHYKNYRGFCLWARKNLTTASK
ncbi:MAG: HAD family hydrolase [Patescibacteria group bacterium]|nr:HAD family hydrolase [Patescibacteria group bacterium]